MALNFDSLLAALGRLTVRQRIQIGVALVATVGLVWGLSVYATRVRYGTLFSRLAGSDAASVVTALKERRVPYRIAEGGGAVEVPVERVDELRLELAAAGLPRGGGVGFEIFDKPAFGLSEFVQNINYRRALEREMGRTIEELDAVESARVHLALPPESVFADEARKPSGSVVLRLRAGRSLSTNQVSAVAHLVASGVEGLEPERVSIIDGGGRMLSAGGEEVGSELNASQLDAKRQLEGNLESTLVAILEPVVGAGRVRARAAVDLDMSVVQRVEERFDPDSAVVRSEQKSRTRHGGAGPGGIPGTASNLPGGYPEDVPAVEDGDESQSSTRNFEINKTVATIAEPVGRLTRQSVAVVVDHALVEEAGPDGALVKKSVPRTEQEMRKITDLVGAAAGIDEQRGDVLIVENIPFDASAPAAALEAERADRSHLWIMIARYAALPLAALLVILLVIRPGLAALRTIRMPVTAPARGSAPPTIAELQASLGRAGQAAATERLPLLRQKLIEAASQDPELAAQVVRGWMGGSERR